MKLKMKHTQPMSQKNRKRVLIVDDDFEFSSLLASHLQNVYNVNVAIVTNAYGAMNELLDCFYDLVILDWHLGGMNGLQALQQVDKALNLDNSLPLSEVAGKIPVIMLSAHDPETLKVASREKRHFHVRKVMSKRQSMSQICANMSYLLAQPVSPQTLIAI